MIIDWFVVEGSADKGSFADGAFAQEVHVLVLVAGRYFHRVSRFVKGRSEYAFECGGITDFVVVESGGEEMISKFEERKLVCKI